MIVSVDVKKGQKPTVDQINMIRAASLREPVEDYDAPELSLDQLRRYKTAADKRKGKNQVTISLTDEEMQKAKGFGADFRNVLEQLIVLALNDQDLMRKVRV